MSALAEAHVMQRKPTQGRFIAKKRPAETAVKCPPTVEEMQKALGLDKIKPIALTPSDAEDFRDKGDPFKEWYEQELRRVYNRKK